MKTTVNKRIKELRITLDLSQIDFAKESDISFSLLSKIETSTEMPSEKVLKKLVKRWNIDAEWLLNGTGELKVEKKNMAEKITTSANPYRDYAIQRLEMEVETWKTQYEKVLDALLRGGGNLGKLLTLKVADKVPAKIIAMNPSKKLKRLRA